MVTQLPNASRVGREINYRQQRELAVRLRLDIRRNWATFSPEEKGKLIAAAEQGGFVTKPLRAQPLLIAKGITWLIWAAYAGKLGDFMAFGHEATALMQEICSLAEEDNGVWQQAIAEAVHESLNQPAGVTLKSRSDVRSFLQSL